MSEERLYHHESVHKITQLAGHSSQFKFHVLEPKEIAVALCNLDSTKSTDHDLIPPNILKIASRELSHPLADLYNRCVESCDWPLQWRKVTRYQCLRKAINKTSRTLSVLGKVLEQLLSKQMTSFFDPMLSTNLTGYRKKQSYETSLIRLVERWNQAVENKNVLGVLSRTDKSKAFDSLHSPLLINKLRAHGFSNNALALMRSYFTNRKNRVRISQETVNDWYATTRDCPQGSAFGLLLWNVFQNDLHVSTNETRLGATLHPASNLHILSTL